MVKSLSLEQQDILKSLYGKVKAADIAKELGVSIYTVYNAAKSLKLTQKLNPTFTLTKKQEQIILGGILGDGSLKKNGSNHYYRECHSINEEEYLKWKFNELRNITTDRLYDIPGRGFTPQIGFQTKNSPTISQYARMTRSSVIELLDELGFIIWVLDDGWFRSNCKSGCFGIARGTLTDQESELLIKKAEKLGLKMHCIGSSKDFSLTTDNNARIKELAYKFFPKDMDIIIKKINKLKVKSMVDSNPLAEISGN